MAYDFLDHTGDLGLDLEAGSAAELFVEALRGFTDCLTEVDRVRVTNWRRLELCAAALDLLLVDWLQEALFLFETEGALFGRAEVVIRGVDDGVTGEPALSARLGGEPFDSSRHPLKVPIKAVTYHGLEVRQKSGLWQARLVFDV